MRSMGGRDGRRRRGASQSGVLGLKTAVKDARWAKETCRKDVYEYYRSESDQLREPEIEA